ncbi:MAG: hypothetical protein PHE84_04205 [bacterium]|nr:hypothetical protein [bacterium]
MDSIADSILRYLWSTTVTTFSHLMIMLGPGIALSLLMNYLAVLEERAVCRVLGFRAYYWIFGWIGTIIHESGHALFCIIFGHRITEIKWFDFNPSEGSLGYVKHSYDPHNLYHQIGNFFIGIGPIVLGTLVVYFSSRYLIGREVFPSLARAITATSTGVSTNIAVLGGAVLKGIPVIFSSLLTLKNLTDWKFYLFLYLTFTVGSSIRLSPPDIKGAWSGFAILSGLLFLFNLLTSWIGDFARGVFLGFSQMYSVFYVVMIFSILMNAAVASLFFLLSASSGKSPGD